MPHLPAARQIDPSALDSAFVKSRVHLELDRLLMGRAASNRGPLLRLLQRCGGRVIFPEKRNRTDLHEVQVRMQMLLDQEHADAQRETDCVAIFNGGYCT